MKNFQTGQLSKSFIHIALCLLILLAPNLALAQEGKTPEDVLMSILITSVLLLAILVLLYVVYALFLLMGALRAQEDGPTASLWDEMKGQFLGIRPMEEEQQIEMHHEYDGIRELDNHLPPWWTYLFYLTIAFGVVYLMVYYVFQAAPLQDEEYQNEMTLAAQQAEQRKLLAGVTLDETNVEPTQDPNELANGEKIFAQLCVACHRADGGGSVGPNLTDEYWIHGGGIRNIFNTIKVGVPQKGMISWQAQISATDIRDVGSYILTLVGSNPPDPKAPQGEIYKP